MIPLCSRDSVTYTDVESGIEYKFMCMTGTLERELYDLFDKIGTATTKDSLDLSDNFINKILLGWKCTGTVKMPDYPLDKNPAGQFPQEEKAHLLGFWRKANTLTVEEKKT